MFRFFGLFTSVNCEKIFQYVPFFGKNWCGLVDELRTTATVYHNTIVLSELVEECQLRGDLIAEYSQK